jgi:hypothetical protein
MQTMKALKTILGAGGVTLLAIAVTAQTAPNKWELSLLGSFNHTWVDSPLSVDNSLNLYDLSVDIGYFVSHPLELRAGFSIMGFDGAIGSDADQGNVSGFVVPLTLGADYHFNTKHKFVPYVGFSIGIFVTGAGFGQDVAAMGSVMGDAHVGFKQFLADNVALNCQLGYQYSPLPFVDLNTVTANLGISFFF